MLEQQSLTIDDRQQEKRNSTHRLPNISMKNQGQLYELQQQQLLQGREMHQMMGLCLFA